MTIETEEDLNNLKIIGRIVAETIKIMGETIESGITTIELDNIGKQNLDFYGARSAPNLVYNFPGITCISVNESVAHGVPSNLALKAGDLINIDVSAELNGYFADSGASFIVPPNIDKNKKELLRATKQALNKSIEEVKDGVFVNVIGKTIEKHARKSGYSVIRDLGSHGVGRSIHEHPEFIAPYYEPKDKRILKNGMVITIEPFLSNGATSIYKDRDGWSLKTEKGFMTAQFEHTMVITKNRPIIITTI